jgi:hypothetical protein
MVTTTSSKANRTEADELEQVKFEKKANLKCQWGVSFSFNISGDVRGSTSCCCPHWLQNHFDLSLTQDQTFIWFCYCMHVNSSVIANPVWL